MNSQYKRSKVGFPIRRSSDHSSFAAPQGLSQRTTSFIASQRQGIHQMLFRHLIALMIHARRKAIGNTPNPAAADQKDRLLDRSRNMLAEHNRSATPARQKARRSWCRGQSPNRSCSLFTMSNTRRGPKGRPRIHNLSGRASRRQSQPALPRAARGPGGARRDRTDDLKLAKLALSQLSYGPRARSGSQ